MEEQQRLHQFDDKVFSFYGCAQLRRDGGLGDPGQAFTFDRHFAQYGQEVWSA